MFKNNTFLNQFLLEFSSLWLPKMEGKFVVFWIFIGKVDFVKKIFFQRKVAIFLVLNLQKWTKFWFIFFLTITSEKMTLKSNLGIDFGFPKPPKSTPKAMLNEACFTTLCKSPGSRRKLTEAIAFGLSKRLRIWLGLLYLLICPSSP